MKIKCAKKLGPLITTPKRIKIIVGGRGSTKSTFVADYMAACMSQGDLICCTRELQNSIDESVHRLLLDEIDRLQMPGFSETKTNITHMSGGRSFYRGLRTNPTAFKSLLTDVQKVWIEEGETLSEETLSMLSASMRLSAKDVELKMLGEDVKMPELWVTMNRGSSADPIAQKWLQRAEPTLSRGEVYEDDTIMVVQINYTDVPKSWFVNSGLEQERLDDLANMSRAMYDHKWLGQYNDHVDGSIILPEWFDACVDAHKIDRLAEAFKPTGAIVASHDPFNDGGDAASFVERHGSIIKQVRTKSVGEVDEVCDWATGLASRCQADWFIWDADGMGTGLKRQISDAFAGTRTKWHMFRGGLSGSAQDNAGKRYDPDDGDRAAGYKPKTYADTFYNNRAQYYFDLARRMKNTYLAVERGKYIDPADMIAFDSDGIDDIMSLKSQICRIPQKTNSRGLLQLMRKEEMKRMGIPSPNEADSIMMSLFRTPTVADGFKINFKGWV